MSSTRGSLRRSGREKKLSVSEYSAGDLVAVRSTFLHPIPAAMVVLGALVLASCEEDEAYEEFVRLL